MQQETVSPTEKLLTLVASEDKEGLLLTIYLSPSVRTIFMPTSGNTQEASAPYTGPAVLIKPHLTMTSAKLNYQDDVTHKGLLAEGAFPPVSGDTKVLILNRDALTTHSPVLPSQKAEVPSLFDQIRQEVHVSAPETNRKVAEDSSHFDQLRQDVHISAPETNRKKVEDSSLLELAQKNGEVKVGN